MRPCSVAPSLRKRGGGLHSLPTYANCGISSVENKLLRSLALNCTVIQTEWTVCLITTSKVPGLILFLESVCTHPFSLVPPDKCVGSEIQIRREFHHCFIHLSQFSILETSFTYQVKKTSLNTPRQSKTFELMRVKLKAINILTNWLRGAEDKFLGFYGNRRSITVLTRCREKKCSVPPATARRTCEVLEYRPLSAIVSHIKLLTLKFGLLSLLRFMQRDKPAIRACFTLQNSSWEADSRCFCQEIFRLLRNPNDLCVFQTASVRPYSEHLILYT